MIEAQHAGWVSLSEAKEAYCHRFITVQDILDCAGIGRSICSHYTDKEDLLTSEVARLIRDLEVYASEWGKGYDAVTVRISRNGPIWDAQPSICLTRINSNLLLSGHEESFYKTTFEMAKREDLFAAEASPQLVSIFEHVMQGEHH